MSANHLNPSDRVVYRAFRDIAAYRTDLFSTYFRLYGTVPTIRHTYHLRDLYSFNYCKRRHFFTLIAPFTRDGRILVERVFASDGLSWNLPGGSLRDDLQETFIDACTRLSCELVANITLGEIQPLVFMENAFYYDGQVCTHQGIAFCARIRNRDIDSDLAATPSSRGQLVALNDESIPFGLIHNQQAISLLRDRVANIDFDATADFEIEENLKYVARYKFHDVVVKPALQLTSRLFGRHTLAELDTKIVDLVSSPPCTSILDVACGENRAIFRLLKVPGVETVIGNDVSWSQIELIRNSVDYSGLRDRQSIVVFTNHDARYLPFPDSSIDVILCKNVLHHMTDIASVHKLLTEMCRVAKRVLIVEIMDPAYESRWGRLRHRYYLRFLHDAGSRFLSREEFHRLTARYNCKDTFEMPTVRGVYMFSIH